MIYGTWHNEPVRAQDVVILIKLHIWNKGRWKLVPLPLAESLSLSKSEVSTCGERSAGFVHTDKVKLPFVKQEPNNKSSYAQAL